MSIEMKIMTFFQRVSPQVLPGLLSLLLATVCAAERLGGSAEGVVKSGEKLNEENQVDFQVGEDKFQTLCLACHAGGMPEAPRVEALELYPPERIVEALNSGAMSTIGLSLSGEEMRKVAFYLTGKTIESKQAERALFLCESEFSASDQKANSLWSSWGGQAGNQRFQTKEKKLTPSNVQNLKLKWAFGFPDTTRVRSQPTVTEAVTYIGSQDGRIYALDNNTGCIHWTFTADAEVRGAINLHAHPETDKRTLLFGDYKASAYALDAGTGKLLWKTRVHEHSLATITGSVAVDDDRVYVPVSSSEVVPAANSEYPCCTFRGALVGLNLRDGHIEWRTYTTKIPVPRGKNSVGTNRFGPSGAPIWSTPSLDKKRNLVMATTGQNYSSPATGTGDAVIAMDATTGEVAWVSQVWENDAWNGGCVRKTANCPEENGPDFDIGASVIISKTASGRELLLVGQKSGLVYAMDPDQKGKILWQQRVGRGGTMGGVHWGMTTDGERLYVGVSDLFTNNPYKKGDAHPGLHALNPLNGKFLWRTHLENTCPKESKFFCDPGISAAVSSSPGLVFGGALDGKLRAFDASDGSILWSYDTHKLFTTVNGVEGRGGAIEADGPVIADGKVFVTSGYDKWGEMPGNVLLVFSLDGQ